MAEEIRCHEQCVHVSLAVVPECGEDSFDFHLDAGGGFLCVADGCGGLGAKRYEHAQEHTGAYLAARLATKCVCDWAKKCAIPETPQEGRNLAVALEELLAAEMKGFEMAHASQRGARIVGSMQRALPTTLCVALVERLPQKAVDLLFLWAGDSRGYLLGAGGLRQLTADHTTAAADALDGLYCDASLQNMINADEPFALSARRLRTESPCLVITATDGAFAYLPTPMEFEWLLLSTLMASETAEKWQNKLACKLNKVASDDCTVLIAMVGYESFEELKESFAERHNELQREYITPVRRRRMNLDYARVKWEAYRKDYDWTEGTAHDKLDWRI